MIVSRCRTIVIAILVGLLYVTWGAMFSLQPTFYPSEAEAKGATPSQYGFVFGIINLFAFIFAPIFARFGSRYIGSAVLFICGSFIIALSNICYGLLVFIKKTSPFIILSYVLRAIEGVADAAAWAAILSILMKIFPSKVAQIISWTETAYGLGYMSGPVIGSGLYQLGGFLIPFVVTGIIAMLLGMLTRFCLPVIDGDAEDNTLIIVDDQNTNLVETPTNSEQDPLRGIRVLNFIEVAKNPSIYLPLIDNLVCFSSIGMIESMLASYLMAHGASTMQIGTTFLILGTVYTIAAPFAGYICDKVENVILVSILGNLFMTFTFVTIGPLPFLHEYLSTSISLIRISMAMAGLGYSLIMVSTFSRAQKASTKLGYGESIHTFSLISGLWSSSFYLGNFLGPTIAGFVVDAFGFQTTTLYFFALYPCILFINLCEVLLNYLYHSRNYN